MFTLIYILTDFYKNVNICMCYLVFLLLINEKKRILILGINRKQECVLSFYILTSILSFCAWNQYQPPTQSPSLSCCGAVVVVAAVVVAAVVAAGALVVLSDAPRVVLFVFVSLSALRVSAAAVF